MAKNVYKKNKVFNLNQLILVTLVLKGNVSKFL